MAEHIQNSGQVGDQEVAHSFLWHYCRPSSFGCNPGCNSGCSSGLEGTLGSGSCCHHHTLVETVGSDLGNRMAPADSVVEQEVRRMRNSVAPYSSCCLVSPLVAFFFFSFSIREIISQRRQE